MALANSAPQLGMFFSFLLAHPLFTPTSSDLRSSHILSKVFFESSTNALFLGNISVLLHYSLGVDFTCVYLFFNTQSHYLALVGSASQVLGLKLNALSNATCTTIKTYLRRICLGALRAESLSDS